jgi:citrate lyase subunit beta/citryl-CoA lyase
MPATKPPKLRRSWVFLGAADESRFAAALACEADALIACLEDGTSPQLRPKGRALLSQFFADCRAVGKVACVRINPLQGDGRADLEAALSAGPDVIFLPKTETPEQISELAELVARSGSNEIEIVPNIETAAGLLCTYAIARSHWRVSACLVASEDMTTSLGAERGRDGIELQYVRSRFLLECRAAGVIPIDCPYTFSDREGLEAETRMARRLGYPAKSAVDAAQAGLINSILTPSSADLARLPLFALGNWKFPTCRATQAPDLAKGARRKNARKRV